ncbi:MAG: M50 family metallopeptidase [Verrucomicrobia bacterium]|nr:M50 family metallopeptidase [Verrucomicrobiota bacterium]
MLLLENPLNLCLGGLILWAIFAFFFRLPPRAYVFAHELTHALFVKLCGGQVKKISVRRDSGYVLSDRSNFLIVLAPYLFPFYAIALGLAAWVAGLFAPIGHFETPLWVGIGFCLGYHWTMTGRMLFTRQSDFSSQGYLFSFALISAINLLLLLAIFLLLPDPRGFFVRTAALGASAAHSYREAFDFLRRFVGGI